MKSLKHLKKLIKLYVENNPKLNPPPTPESILKIFDSPSDSKMASYIFFQYLESWFQSIVESLNKILSKGITNQGKQQKLQNMIKNEKSENFKMLTIMNNKENRKFLYETLNLYNDTKKLANKIMSLFQEIDKCSQLIGIPPQDNENFPNKLANFQLFFKGGIYDVISSSVFISNVSGIIKEDKYVQQYIADELSDNEWDNLYEWLTHFFILIFKRNLGLEKTNDLNTISRALQKKCNADKTDIKLKGRKLYTLCEFIKNILALAGQRRKFDSIIIGCAKENFEDLSIAGIENKKYKYLKILIDFSALKKN